MRKILFFILLFIVNFGFSQTFTNSTAVSIPDNDAVTGGWSEINVSGLNPVSEVVSVQINISHTWDSDLLIQLEFYDDTYTLSNQNGGSGDNYTNTVFNNAASTSITSGTAPFNSTYIPEVLLPTFVQSFNPNGTWRLHVYDLASGDVGTINSWSITFQAPPCPTVDYGTLPATMSCTDSDTILFVNNADVNGGWACPALFFEFNIDASAETTTDNTVTIYEDGSPIYSDVVTTDRLTVYSISAYFSPSSNYTFTATDNDGTMTWLVYDENGTSYSGAFTNTTVNEGPWSPQGTSSWTCVPTNGITGTGDWGAALFDPSVVGAGTYTITYTWDNQGTAPRHCTGSASHSVTVTNPWSAAWTSPGTVCDNGGSLDLNSFITGNTGGTWTGSGVSGSTFNPSGLSGNIAITYTVGSSSACQSQEQHNITVTPHATANAGSNATICENDNYTLSGSATNYSSVSWSTSGSGTFGNASALSTTYMPSSSDIANGSVVLTLTAHGNSPCSDATSSMTLTINPQPTANAGSNASICEGETYTLSGSATNYSSVTWTTSGNGSFNNASSLTATYTPGSIDISNGSVVLTLTTNDPVGPCNAASSSMTLTINPLDDATFSYPSSTFCQSGTDPSPSVITPGGTFTFSPAGLVINSSTGVIDLSASAINTYDVTYSTSGACPDASTIQITITLAPSADFSYAQSDYCSDEPNPLPTFPSGASAGTFSASPSGLFFVNTATGEINLSATSPGTYTITNNIPASGGCAAASHSESVSVYPAATASAGQDAAICSYDTYVLSGSIGGSATSNIWTTSGDGTFDNPTSLTPTYTPGTNDISNGSVTLTITTDDPSGACGPATDDMVLTIHNAPVLSANITDVTDCSSPNGEIDLHTTGGDSPLNFSIDNGSNFSTDSSFFNVSGGFYQTMVVDVNNCMDTLTVFVGAPASPQIDSVVTNDLLCAGDTSGSITIYPATDSLYSINNGVTFQSSNIFTGLTGGNYQIVVQNSGGCLSDTNLTITINEPQALSLTLTPTSPLCSGECNGQMDLTVTGGTTPYTISWSTGDNNVYTIDSLCGGSYNVTVVDNNGCQSTSFESIVIPSAINITPYVSDVVCFGLNNGYISIIVTGGTPPFTYNWSNGTSLPTDTLLSGGYYSLTLTDANNCQEFIDSIHVKEPDNILINASNQQDPYCTGNNDGRITINVTGGTPPYTYSWNNGSTDNTVSFLPAGTYTVTVTDFNNCENSQSFTLDNISDLTITGQAIVNNQFQGNIDITVTGGDSLDTYTYLWSNQATTEDVENLGPGIYTVTVTDNHNCLATDSFEIKIPLIIPTIFTPNGDSHNDTWRITNIESYNDVHIEIYDRWGDMVFTFDGTGLEYTYTDNQWDGTYNGKKLPFTSYVYIVSLNHDKEVYNGTVTIKR